MICVTMLHDVHGREVRRCGGTMILRNPSYDDERRLNRLDIPVYVCTNPICGTALVADQAGVS